ncbi:MULTISPECIES: hypothetical protein [Actinokineospora]|uniref:Uncharacterized protein n=1 Tax=Actinokineospora fastidiosa TaxID=1816 RepID=A0A918G6F1_9PSEU|nr:MULTISPECIES: hypothetical protein [Actinokineospora]UVS82512.1 hypothetical protein Actkin_06285 [Actinokineospora sp. UTMC 2448]GGS20574.1 hypothetical protein GCM10010171_11540 [Actinokineospora fastidiosa]
MSAGTERTTGTDPDLVKEIDDIEDKILEGDDPSTNGGPYQPHSPERVPTGGPYQPHSPDPEPTGGAEQK